MVWNKFPTGFLSAERPDSTGGGQTACHQDRVDPPLGCNRWFASTPYHCLTSNLFRQIVKRGPNLLEPVVELADLGLFQSMPVDRMKHQIVKTSHSAIRIEKTLDSFDLVTPQSSCAISEPRGPVVLIALAQKLRCLFQHRDEFPHLWAGVSHRHSCERLPSADRSQSILNTAGRYRDSAARLC
jgi:hypothetical protein